MGYSSAVRDELGRVTGQLASKNRKLAIRAKFFEALSGFQGELRPEAPPQTVLHAIGQTAIAVLDVTSAAVFSLPPGREYAEAVLVDDSGEVFETTLVDVDTSAFASRVSAAPDAAPRSPQHRFPSRGRARRIPTPVPELPLQLERTHHASPPERSPLRGSLIDAPVGA